MVGVPLHVGNISWFAGYMEVSIMDGTLLLRTSSLSQCGGACSPVGFRERKISICRTAFGTSDLGCPWHDVNSLLAMSGMTFISSSKKVLLTMSLCVIRGPLQVGKATRSKFFQGQASSGEVYNRRRTHALKRPCV